MSKTALSSIGITVKINNVAVWGAVDFSDLGAAPSTIDATKLTDAARVYIPGIKDIGLWTVTYQYETGDETTDYDRLKTLETAHTKNVPVSVEFSNGDVFSTTGEVSTYIQGRGLGEVITAVASVALDAPFEKVTA